MIEEIAHIFKILSDPTRLKLFKLLYFNDESKLCVINLADKLSISQPAITQHINILKNSNLVEEVKDKNQRIYSINKQQFSILKKILIESLNEESMHCNFPGKCSECPNNPDAIKNTDK